MFTGIVEHIGTVLAVRATTTGARLRIDVGPLAVGLMHGASIAVDGVCLTVSASGDGWAEFDAVPETLSHSTLGALRTNSRVNLERALSAGSRLDGHFVQGHVDCTATVLKVTRSASEVRFGFRLDQPDLAIHLVPKGSVAVSGVSLTLADVQDAGFEVALIPTTLAKTTLPDRSVGDKVNIETDMLARILIGYLRRVQGQNGENRGSAGAELGQTPGASAPEKITMDQLREAGWLES